MKRILAWVIVLAVARGAMGQPAGDVLKTGEMGLSFTERSSKSALAEIRLRTGWTVDAMEKTLSAAKVPASEMDYELANEHFEAFIPKSYDGSKPFGLLVWASPDPQAAPRREWIDALDKHELIWIGAKNAGNERAAFWCRMGLAVDAAENMKWKYKIDEKRVYIGGVSGGGRVASMLGVCWPDVFHGGLYIIGANFYRQIASVEQASHVFRQQYSRPEEKLFTMAKKQSRHVYFEGEKDINREQSLFYSRAMKQDGFAYVSYFEAPGLGHEPPDGEWFEKAIAALTEPIAGPPMAAARPAAEPATPTTRSASSIEATPASDAERLLRLAKTYLESDMPDGARERLKAVIEKYPDNSAATEAKKLLDGMGR